MGLARVWMVAGVLSCLPACGGGGDEGGNGGGGTGVRTLPPSTALFGLVTAGDVPLEGVTVEVNGKTATTDGSGKYGLKIAAAPRVVVKFSRAGYLASTRTAALLDKKQTAVDAVLVAEATATPLDADAGGMVAGGRGAKMVAPAGAFVKPDGSPAAGMVDVHLTPLDPTVESEVNGASGDFLGVDAPGGSPQLLRSFGMLDVTVRQGADTLQVAPGQALQIEVPAPSDMEMELLPTVPLWSFDQAADRWVLEGEATLDPATRTYRAEIRHMSAWNIDQRVDATCITGIVKNADDGTPLPGSRVRGAGLDYTGTSSTHTGEDGRFYLAVRKSSRVSVLASHDAGGGQEREVESGDADTTIPPTPGDPRCLDVGEWRVTRAVLEFADGRTVNCAEVPNPFRDSCVSDIFGTIGCYDPTGPCDVRTSGVGGSVTVYENGSRVESSYDQASGSASSKVYGPDGLCFEQEFQIPEDDSGEVTEIKFRLADGREFQFEIDDERDIWTIRCPDGRSQTITRGDMDALEACSAEEEGDESDVNQCTINGMEPGSPGSVPGGGGVPEGYGMPCPDGTCANGELVCCAIPQEGSEPVGICLTQMICDVAISAAGRGD